MLQRIRSTLRGVIARHSQAEWIGIVAIAFIGSIVIAWLLRDLLDKHEGTAAWVQAVGSILIIAATAWIANRDSRERRERERNARQQVRQSIAVLAGQCMSALDEFLSQVPAHLPPDHMVGRFFEIYVPTDLGLPLDALGQVQLHELDDATLINAVLMLRSVMARIIHELEAMRILGEVKLNPAVGFQSLQHARNLRVQAFNAFASVARIIKGNAAERELSQIVGRVF